MSKGKTTEKLMRCELKQQIGYSYVSIAQEAINEAARVKNDSKIVLWDTWPNCFGSTVPSFMLLQLLSFCSYLDRYGKRPKSSADEFKPIQSKLKLMKVEYSRRGLILCKNLSSKVEK